MKIFLIFFFFVGLFWLFNFGKKVNKLDQVKDIKDKFGLIVIVGFFFVMVDKYGVSKDNNSVVGVNNEFNIFFDLFLFSFGFLVEFSFFQFNIKEVRFVKLW